MKRLVELIDHVEKSGKKIRKFSNLKYFYERIEKPQINYYTYDFDIIQKNNLEIKEDIIKSIRNYKNFELIKDNLKNAIIFIRPSGDAEKIVKDYWKNLKECGITNSVYEINCYLDKIYKKMGFVGNNNN